MAGRAVSGPALFVSGPSSPLPALFPAGPGALCRGPVSGPSALCWARRSLFVSGPALCVGARRFVSGPPLPALFVSGPGALCRGPALLASGPGALCRGSASGKILNFPYRRLALSVSLSRPNDLCVRARRSLCRGPARGLAQRVWSPECFCIGARRSPTLSVSGPGALRGSLCVGTRRFVSACVSGPGDPRWCRRLCRLFL